MIIKDFLYNDIKLSDKGYIICSFNGGLDDVSMGTRLTFNRIKSAKNDKMKTTSVEYEEVLTTNFDIAKYDCNTGIFDKLNMNDVSNMTRWLNQHSNKKLVFLDTEDGYNQVYYLGSFVTVDPIVKDSNIIGLHVEFESCLSYALLNITKTYNVAKLEQITIKNDDDSDGYHIPSTIKIAVKEAGTLKIENLTTNKITEFKNCIANEVITINGETSWVESSVGSHDIADDFNYEFIKLVRKDNIQDNILKFSLACQFDIEMNYIRKVGII